MLLVSFVYLKTTKISVNFSCKLRFCIVPRADCCPHEIEDVGWFTCDSNQPCAEEDIVCVPPPPIFLSFDPDMKICARKPCHRHSNCKPRRYCYKKYILKHFRNAPNTKMVVPS